MSSSASPPPCTISLARASRPSGHRSRRARPGGYAARSPRTPRACASGSSWLRPSSTTPTSWSSTNRSKGSTPASGSGRSSCSAVSGSRARRLSSPATCSTRSSASDRESSSSPRDACSPKGSSRPSASLMDDRPHHLRVGTDRPARLAAGPALERRRHQRPDQRRLDRGGDHRRRRLPAVDRGGGPGLRCPAHGSACPRR